jgi:two-component system heavy metal sensor histidine kinase CusS
MATSLAARRPISLVLRLTIAIGAAVTFIFFALGVVIERSIDQHFAEQDADELNAVVSAIHQRLNQLPETETPDISAAAISQTVAGHHGAFLFNVIDAKGRVRYGSPGTDLSRLFSADLRDSTVNEDALVNWLEGSNLFRGAAVRVRTGAKTTAADWRIAVAINMNVQSMYLDRFRQILWLTTAIACLFAILCTWAATYYGIAPIRHITRKIRGITSDRLDVRLEPQAFPVELVPLATSFNDMLERIGEGFSRLSNFSADIAHELRTPITNLTTQTQVALAQARTAAQYREILYSNQEEFDRMSKMVGDMLFLAQADNTLGEKNVAVLEARAEVEALFDFFEALAEEQSVTLRVSGGPITLSANQLMFRRALSNLLSNAIRHTSAGHAVTVKLTRQGTWCRISVTNPGVDIPPEHLTKIFDRFYRVDPSRQRNGDGSGLGLAIVKSIVDAHGGQVMARSSGGLTEVEIRLPLPDEASTVGT